MSREFVAVGGTGQHVALAMADLLVLAHSAVPTPWPPVRFTLIDADPASGDPSRPSAWELACLQRDALSAFPPGVAEWPGKLERKPHPKLPDGASTAASSVNDLYGPGAAELLLAPRQHELDVGTGYHGEPWVAAALTERLLDDLTHNRLDRDDALNQLRNRLGTAGSRICVAGSAIGGTGAGVLPRLVQHFASHGDRHAALCAVIGLPWFQLDRPQGQNLDMDANATATLWHYQDTLRAAPYRLVLWGHPAVESAATESHDGSAKQSSKRDLTLPYQAAASALSFLLANNDAEATLPGVYAFAPAPERTAIPERMRLGAEFFGDVLTRNHRVMERLHLLRWYAGHGRKGWAIRMLQAERFVKDLDALDQETFDNLVSRVDGLIAAKEVALGRLRAAQTAEEVGTPGMPEREGILALREYFKGIRTAQELPSFAGRVPPPGELRAQSTNARVLSNRASAEVGFPPVESGTADSVQGRQWESLVPFHEVACTRIPDLRAPELMVRSVLSNLPLWDVSAQGKPANPANPALRDTLIKAGQPVVPPRLQSEAADRYPAWMRRWVLLAAATITGNARAAEERVGRPGGEHSWLPLKSWHPGAEDDGLPLGFHSTKWLVVPTPTRFWDAEGLPLGLSRRLGQLGRVKGWLQAVRQVGECRFGRDQTPRWVQFLDAALDQVIAIDPGPCNPLRRVRVEWAGVEVSLPVLDDGAGAGRAALLHTLCAGDAFNLEARLLDPQQIHNESARRAWGDIERVTARGVPLLRDEAAMMWHRPELRDVTWVDCLSSETRTYLNGDLFLVPGEGTAYKLPQSAIPLTAERVLLDRLTVLPNGTPRPTILWPVQGRYAGLVTNCRFEVHGDGSYTAHVTLRGRDPLEPRSYPATKVNRVSQEQVTVLLWPKVLTTPDASLTVLVAPTASRVRLESRVLFGAAADLGGASPWLPSGRRFRHLRPADTEVRGGGAPHALELRAADGEAARLLLGLSDSAPRGTGPVPLGLWTPSTPVRRGGDGSGERWCVDLGTSSTVVAYATGPESQAQGADTVGPAPNRDGTVICSLGDAALTDRKTLNWMPTWHRNASIGPEETAPFLPSQVVEVAETPGSPPLYGEDWVLDHGAPLEAHHLPRVRDNFKWRSDDLSRQLRSGFLRQVLEQAVEMECSRRPQGEEFPRRIPLTVTLPIRQRSRLDGFSREVTDILAKVRLSTGVQFEPRYEWESSAVAPRNTGLAGKGLVVVADLGGGTLDLWAQLHDDGVITRTAAESAYVGARACVDVLIASDRAADLANAATVEARRALIQEGRRLYRRVPDPMQQVQIRNNRGAALYYDVVFRLTAQWAHAVAKAWNVDTNEEKVIPVRLVVAGLGWSIAFSREDDALRRLNAVTRELELPVRFSAERPDPLAADERSRKTWLARNAAATGRGRAPNELLAGSGEALPLDNVLGISVQLSRATKGGKERERVTLAPHDLVSAVGSELGVLLDQEAVTRFLPSGLRVDPGQVAERLARREDGTEQSLGCRDTTDGALIVSPLACVAEAAVEAIRAEFARSVLA